MGSEFDLETMDKKIQLIKRTAEELRKVGEKIPAVEKNTNRLLASLKMLEINISDCTRL